MLFIVVVCLGHAWNEVEALKSKVKCLEDEKRESFLNEKISGEQYRLWKGSGTSGVGVVQIPPQTVTNSSCTIPKCAICSIVIE
jgi:hypothetical protein